MSQLPSDQSTGGTRRRALTYDELIAMFVAFLTLGSVLFWGLTRSGVNFFGDTGLFASNAPALLDSEDSISGVLEQGGLELESGQGDEDASVGPQGAAANDMFGNGSPSANRANQQPTPPGDPITSQQTTTPIPVTPVQPPPQQAAQPANPQPVTESPATAPLESVRDAVEFTDVPDDYWAKPYIDALSERLVLDGLAEGRFAPEEPVTRAQLASAIAQAFPLEDEDAAIPFSDVEATFWATEAIEKSVKGGFMSGFPDQSFQPDLLVPRAQVLTALVTGLDAPAPDDVQTVLARYSDTDQIPAWATEKMAAATLSSIVVNYPDLGALKPNQSATRAEVAAMIYQTLVAQGRVEAIDGSYVIQP